MKIKMSTADRYYYLEEKMISAERAADQLDSMMQLCMKKQESDSDSNAIEQQNIQHQESADITCSRFMFTVEECQLIQNTFAVFQGKLPSCSQVNNFGSYPICVHWIRPI